MNQASNFRLRIQYDGRPFCGWQRQPNGLSIQECIERACGQIAGRSCAVHGAGRTDAGVHAMGQVASVAIPTTLPPARLRRAINAHLPPEIRIVSVRREAPEFHARKHALGKTYRYLVLEGEQRSPFAPFYAAWLPRRLEADRMNEAAAHLIGRRDFSSFRAAGSSVKSSIRDLRKLEIRRGGGMVSFVAVADGFLRHMVRNIVGTLIEVGVGRLEPEDVIDILEAKDRKLAGPTAPAAGLTLLKVDY